MTVAQLQTHVYEDKMKNVEMLTPLLWQAKEYHADFVCLPEMFACPYETKNFPVYAEEEGRPPVDGAFRTGERVRDLSFRRIRSGADAGGEDPQYGLCF